MTSSEVKLRKHVRGNGPIKKEADGTEELCDEERHAETRSMAPLNAVFFLLSCGQAAFQLFIVVFFREIGFDNSQIGSLLSARAFAGLFGALIWGPLADYFSTAKVMFFGLIAAMVLSTSLVFESLQTDFTLFTWIFALSSVCTNSQSLMDAICIKILMAEASQKKEENASDSYGKTRWYASLGYGVTGLIMALFTHSMGATLVFICFDAFTLFGLCILYWFYIRNAKTDATTSQTETSMSRADVWNAICSQFGSLDAAVYGANILVYGCLKALLDNFVFLTVLDAMNGSLLLCGVGNAIQVGLGEIPPFIEGQFLLKRFGITKLFTLGLISYVLCAVGFCVVVVLCANEDCGHWQWLFVLFEPFHGANYSLMWIATIAFCARSGQRQVQGTTQAIVRFVFQRVAGAIGALIGAAVVDAYGFLALWTGAALIAFLWTLAFFFISKLIPQTTDETKRKTE